MSERAVNRLAYDLQNGNSTEAASICRSELNANPQSALQEIRQANQMAGQNARLHVGTRHSDGDIAIVDQNGQVMTRIGSPYQQSQGYDTGFNNAQRYPNQLPQDGSYPGQVTQRYPNQFPQDGNYPGQVPQRYPNQFPQDGNYPGQVPQDYTGQFSQNGRYPGQIPQDGWQNGGFQGNYNQERMQVQRLAQDLAFGNTREAAYITQNLLQSPDGARAIQSANQLADMEARQYGRYRAAEHALTMRNGQEVLVSDRGQILAGCGNIYEAQNMMGPSQFAPSPVNFNGNDGYNGGYNGNNGAYFNGGYPPQTYPPQTYYPQQNYNNNGNLASFGIGTAVGLTLSSIFRGGGGYHGRGRR